MIRNNTFICLILFFLVSVFPSCKKGKEHVTQSGFKYRLYTENQGRKPQIGDYVIIELVYKTAKDSVLFDSRKTNNPMRFKLEKIPFLGSYEEGLTYLSEGDSATFFVPADSLFKYYFSERNQDVKQSATVFNEKSFFKFDVKLVGVQDYLEAEQDQMMKQSIAEKKERESLRAFLFSKDFISSNDSGMYYYKKIKNGEGEFAAKGKFVSVQYTGKLLDGKVFDHQGGQGQPFIFRVGAAEVVKGIENAITVFRVGDRFELVVPSAYAYGEEGLLDVTSGEYLVPPFTALWYEMELIQVQDTLRFVKK